MVLSHHASGIEVLKKKKKRLSDYYYFDPHVLLHLWILLLIIAFWKIMQCFHRHYRVANSIHNSAVAVEYIFEFLFFFSCNVSKISLFQFKAIPKL